MVRSVVGVVNGWSGVMGLWLVQCNGSVVRSSVMGLWLVRCNGSVVGPV